MSMLRTWRTSRALAFLFLIAWSLVHARLARALTLEEALQRARAQAPEVLRARTRVDAARADVAVAEVLLRDDPSLEASVGPRYTVDDVWIPQLSVGLSQQFELSSARDARIAAARTRVDEAEASTEESTRQARLAVGTAFVDAVHARDAVAASVGACERADALLEAAEARASAGDTSTIDVRRLRMGSAQARADAHAANAALVLALARLRALLDVPPGEPLEIEGALAKIALAPGGAGAERPELAVLRAAMREAEAEMRLADARRIPELGVGIGYQLEEGDHLGLVTLSLTLPVFDRGGALHDAAEARRNALEVELALRERVIDAQRATARDVLPPLHAALEESARSVAAADELDAMIEASWRAGESSLTELLVVRAEVQSARRAHLDRLRDAGLARVALQAALGLELEPRGDAP